MVESPYFRITGGAVWTRPGNDPLLRYVGPTWHYDGAHWSGMRFDGKCRLVFGLPRDPAGISDLLSVVTIYACALSTNGVPYAVYEPNREMWRGAASEVWWPSFRIETLSLRPLESDPRQRGIYVVVPPIRQHGPTSTH
jgi:hypothetical protein